METLLCCLLELRLNLYDYFTMHPMVCGRVCSIPCYRSATSFGACLGPFCLIFYFIYAEKAWLNKKLF
jgi:hypothetical protein